MLQHRTSGKACDFVLRLTRTRFCAKGAPWSTGKATLLLAAYIDAESRKDKMRKGAKSNEEKQIKNAKQETSEGQKYVYQEGDTLKRGNNVERQKSKGVNSEMSEGQKRDEAWMKNAVNMKEREGRKTLKKKKYSKLLYRVAVIGRSSR